MVERDRACGDLRERLCADLGAHTRACKIAREQTGKFPADRCLAMRRAYPEVRRKLAATYEPNRVSAEAAAKLVAGNLPSRGSAQAKLQLVLFIDFASPYCVQAAAIVRELEAKYGESLRVVIRMFPLPDNPHARLAAEAALAAHAQGKFWQMHDLLLARQKQLDRPALERYAAEAGLDVTAFKTALDRRSHASAVDADLALVQELDLTAMPSAFLNGEQSLNAVEPQLWIDAADEILDAL